MNNPRLYEKAVKLIDGALEAFRAPTVDDPVMKRILHADGRPVMTHINLTDDIPVRTRPYRIGPTNDESPRGYPVRGVRYSTNNISLARRSVHRHGRSCVRGRCLERSIRRTARPPH